MKIIALCSSKEFRICKNFLAGYVSEAFGNAAKVLILIIKIAFSKTFRLVKKLYDK